MKVGAIYSEISLDTKDFKKAIEEAKGLAGDLGNDLEKSTNKGSDSFDNLSKTSTTSLKKVSNSTKEVSNDFTNLGDIVAGNVIADGISNLVSLAGDLAGVVFDISDEIQSSQGQIRSELGLTAEESKKLSKVATDIFGNNFGGSVTEAKDALVGVKKQIIGIADEDLKKVTEGVLGIRDAFNTDLTQSTQAVGVLTNKFGVSSETALNMIASGFQNGLDNSGDFLDTINEYGVIFSEGGASADQFFNILATGQQAGVLGTDKVADSFKELNATILDGSMVRADSLDAIGLNSTTFLSDLASGKKTTVEAYDEILTALKNTEDGAVKNQAAVALLGTMTEDMGFDSINNLSLVQDKWSENTTAVDEVNARYQNLGSVLEGLNRKALLALQPLMDGLASLLLPLLQNESALESIALGLGAIAITALYVATPALTAMIAPAWAVVAPLLPIIGTITAIGVVVAGLYYLWDTNFMGMKDATNSLTTFLQSIFVPILTSIQNSWAKITEVMQPVIDAIWSQLQPAFKAIYDIIQPFILPVLGLLTGLLFGPVLTALGAVIGILYGFAVALNFVAQNIEKWRDDALRTFSDMKEKGLNIINGFVDFIKSAFNIDLYQVGTDIVNGLINGIKNMGGTLKQTMKNMAWDAVNSAKQALQIKSPSRVMEAQVGEQIINGTTQGITDNLGDLANASSLIGQTVASNSFDNSQNNNFTQTNNYNISSNGGVDYKEIERRQAKANRSSFLGQNYSI